MTKGGQLPMWRSYMAICHKIFNQWEIADNVGGTVVMRQQSVAIYHKILTNGK
jgi:hypothetical protein